MSYKRVHWMQNVQQHYWIVQRTACAVQICSIRCIPSTKYRSMCCNWSIARRSEHAKKQSVLSAQLNHVCVHSHFSRFHKQIPILHNMYSIITNYCLLSDNIIIPNIPVYTLFFFASSGSDFVMLLLFSFAIVFALSLWRSVVTFQIQHEFWIWRKALNMRLYPSTVPALFIT